MHKLIFIDVEGTGNGKDIDHGILELAMEYWVMYATGRIEHIDSFYTKISPSPIWKYQELRTNKGQTIFANHKKAMEFSKMGLPTEEEAFKKLIYWLDKHIRGTDKSDKASLYAFKSEFDMTLLRNLFERQNNNFLHAYVYKTDICIQRLAAEYVGANRHLLPGERLQDFCRKLDIPFDEALLHNASYDCELARTLYFRILKLFKDKLNSLINE